jgi:hypothetical protein
VAEEAILNHKPLILINMDNYYPNYYNFDKEGIAIKITSEKELKQVAKKLSEEKELKKMQKRRKEYFKKEKIEYKKEASKILFEEIKKCVKS